MSSVAQATAVTPHLPQRVSEDLCLLVQIMTPRLKPAVPHLACLAAHLLPSLPRFRRKQHNIIIARSSSRYSSYTM